MKHYIFCIIFYLFASVLSAQIAIQDTALLVGRATMTQSGGGAGYWQVSGNFYDDSGLYDATEIAIGDYLFFTDAGLGYHLPVTAIISATPPSYTIRVSNVGITGIVSVPTVIGAIYRPSNAYNLMPHVANISAPDEQTYFSLIMKRIEQAVLSQDEITDYTGIAGVSPAVPANTRTGETWRNSAGELYRSDGTAWTLIGGITGVLTTGAVQGDGTTGNAINLAQQGATSGQVLKWNGSAWLPANDNVGSVSTTDLQGTARTSVTNGTGAVLGASPVTVDVNEAGLNPANIPISDGGNYFTTDNINAALQQLGANAHVPVTVQDGTIIDLTLVGQQITATVIAGSITSTEIANGTIGASDLSSFGASTGQSIQWNGSTWVAYTPVTGVSAGAGISVTGTAPTLTVTNAAPDQVVAIVGGGIVSVTGTYPNFTVTGTEAQTATTVAATPTAPLTGTTVQAQLNELAAQTHAPVTVTDDPTIDFTLAGQNVTAKIAQQGATAGQVLTWDGTTWTPENATSGARPQNEIVYGATGSNSSEAGFEYDPASNKMVVMGSIGIGRNNPEAPLTISENGKNLEFYPEYSGRNMILSYDRSLSSWRDLEIKSNNFRLQMNGNDHLFTSTGNVVLGGNTDVNNQRLSVSGNIVAGGNAQPLQPVLYLSQAGGYGNYLLFDKMSFGSHSSNGEHSISTNSAYKNGTADTWTPSAATNLGRLAFSSVDEKVSFWTTSPKTADFPNSDWTKKVEFSNSGQYVNGDIEVTGTIKSTSIGSTTTTTTYNGGFAVESEALNTATENLDGRASSYVIGGTTTTINLPEIVASAPSSTQVLTGARLRIFIGGNTNVVTINSIAGDVIRRNAQTGTTTSITNAANNNLFLCIEATDSGTWFVNQ